MRTHALGEERWSWEVKGEGRWRCELRGESEVSGER
jgi:hypothetical protein